MTSTRVVLAVSLFSNFSFAVLAVVPGVYDPYSSTDLMVPGLVHCTVPDWPKIFFFGRPSVKIAQYLGLATGNLCGARAVVS